MTLSPRQSELGRRPTPPLSQVAIAVRKLEVGEVVGAAVHDRHDVVDVAVMQPERSAADPASVVLLAKQELTGELTEMRAALDLLGDVLRELSDYLDRTEADCPGRPFFVGDGAGEPSYHHGATSLSTLPVVREVASHEQSSNFLQDLIDAVHAHAAGRAEIKACIARLVDGQDEESEGPPLTRLRLERLMARYRLNEAARLMGVAPPHLSSVELQQEDASKRLQLRAAVFYGRDEEYLFVDEPL